MMCRYEEFVFPLKESYNEEFVFPLKESYTVKTVLINWHGMFPRMAKSILIFKLVLVIYSATTEITFVSHVELR